jgi:hypothetical protein
MSTLNPGPSRPNMGSRESDRDDASPVSGPDPAAVRPVTRPAPGFFRKNKNIVKCRKQSGSGRDFTCPFSTLVGSVSEHFANLWYAKRCKTCVAGLNALFRGTKVVKHPFYSIRFKMIFGSVSEHFANLRHVKRCNTCVRAWMHYFWVPKLWIIHSIH